MVSRRRRPVNPPSRTPTGAGVRARKCQPNRLSAMLLLAALLLAALLLAALLAAGLGTSARVPTVPALAVSLAIR